MGKEGRKDQKQGWVMSKKERIAYYLGCAGFGGNNGAVGMFLTTYLILSGVDVVVSALILLLVKIIDAVDDILLGWLADRITFKKRWPGPGKYLPWLRIGAFILPISTILLFRIPQSFSTVGKLIWYAVAYMVWDIAYTMCDMPNGAITTTMTTNNDERMNILSKRYVAMIGLIYPILAVATILMSENVGVSISNTMFIVTIIFFIFSLIEVLTVRERVVEEMLESDDGENELKGEGYSIKQMFAYLKSNKMMLLLYGSKIAIGALGSKVGVFVGFYLFGSSLYSLIFMFGALIPSLIIMALLAKILKKVSKVKLVSFACVMYVIIMVTIFFFGSGAKVAIIHYVLYVLSLIFLQIPVLVVPMMIPDLAEYGRYKTGINATGITFSMGTFVEKLNSAISSSLGLILIGLFGWVAVQAADFSELAALGVTQPASALSALWFVHTLLPAIGAAIMFILLRFYKIKEKDVPIMILANNGEITREDAEKQMGTNK